MIMDHMYHMGSAIRWQYKCIWTCQMLCCDQKSFFGLFSCLIKATPDGTSGWLCFLILTLIKNSNLIPPYNNSNPSIKSPTACADLIWGLRLTQRATLYQILYVSRGLSDKLHGCYCQPDWGKVSQNWRAALAFLVYAGFCKIWSSSLKSFNYFS